MKKRILLLFIAFISLSSLLAQNLNDKIQVKIEKSTVFRDDGYHDSFVFITSLTGKAPIRMTAFGVFRAKDHSELYYLEKYTFGLQEDCELITSYTCVDDKESIYRSNTNQWIITIKYVNTEDGKEYVKNLITPLNSDLKRIFLEEYKGTTGIENPQFSKRGETKYYNLYGGTVQKSYKGIIISNGRKYLNKQ